MRSKTGLIDHTTKKPSKGTETFVDMWPIIDGGTKVITNGPVKI